MPTTPNAKSFEFLRLVGGLYLEERARFSTDLGVFSLIGRLIDLPNFDTRAARRFGNCFATFRAPS